MGKERVREVVRQSITPEYLQSKLGEGWRPVAIEWERDVGAGGPGAIPVPYGLEVAPDGESLRSHEGEMACLRTILAQIVRDRPLSEVAAELESRGLRRRDGSSFSQTSVFALLPRVIEMAPAIYDSAAWQAERPRLRSVPGGAGQSA